MFPPNDTQFEEYTIYSVRGSSAEGWMIGLSGGTGIGVPENSPVIPEVGMPIRLYGKGFGYVVRGMFLNGHEVYYRTSEEDQQHHLETTYGKTAQDWLQRWDDDRAVWSIEMGGMGPGYEQCIQVLTAEMLRYMLKARFDVEPQKVWKEIDDELINHPVIQKLGGPSNNQWGAAKNLASQLYTRGPIAALTDERVKDRKIMVMRKFPNPYAE